VLASCLAALVNQSLDKSKYEVIVADDGSEDSTEQFCRGLSPDFQFCYCRQKNSGAGAARNLGLSKARGKYILFINDDTIASATLLEEHLRAHRSCPGKKFAVLGDFVYPSFASRRALTYFLSKRPFLFPQVSMSKGFYQGSAYFITCNLSVARQAVLEAGSFDSRFRIAEDTELGVRLASRGYEILYWPAARATHDHLNFQTDDIVRRARSYGPATLLLFRKHPSLLGDGNGPLGRLDAAWKARTLNVLQNSRRQVEEALAAVRRLDDFDFTTLLRGKLGGVASADGIISLLEKAFTQVYWFYHLEAIVNGLDETESGTTEMQGLTSASEEANRLRCPL
jgi:GT2 family glycosyltransferase